MLQERTFSVPISFLGIYATTVNHGNPLNGKWARLGTCEELPLVVVSGISYEAYSDTLVVATFGSSTTLATPENTSLFFYITQYIFYFILGRGVYRMRTAKKVIATLILSQIEGACGTWDFTPQSSAMWLPSQMACK